MQPRPASRQHTLVTGVTGFAGCYLAEALVARGERVVGLSRRAVWPEAWRHLAGAVELRSCDLEDRAAVERVMAEVAPAHIYHLAGYAHVGASFRDPEAAWVGNLTATRRLCEALLSWGGRPRVLSVGSGLVYGRQADPDRPLDESAPLCPDTPYAASKAAADLACFQYGCTGGLEMIRARPFNHTGPHQSPEFAIPGFARQLVAIERQERAPVLDTGDLSAQRDLTDVRDMVMAYILLMEHGRPGEAYNIATGRIWSMQAVLDCLLTLVGFPVTVRRRDDLVRPSEPAVVRVDTTKLRRETPWQPRYPLEQTLADTLAAFRSALPGGSGNHPTT